MSKRTEILRELVNDLKYELDNDGYIDKEEDAELSGLFESGLKVLEDIAFKQFGQISYTEYDKTEQYNQNVLH